MLKRGFAIVVCAAALLLTGCAPKDDFADYEFVEPPAVEGLTARTEFSEYDGETEGINVIVMNDRDEYFYFGDNFYLQKYFDDEWRPIKVSGDFQLLGMIMPKRATGSIRVTFKDSVKLPLLPGRYRVWIGSRSDEKVSAEFTVK